jgi:hypothetical protein
MFLVGLHLPLAADGFGGVDAAAGDDLAVK